MFEVSYRTSDLLFWKVLCGIRFEKVLVPVGAEVIGFAFVRVRKFGVLVHPKTADRVLDLTLFAL